VTEEVTEDKDKTTDDRMKWSEAVLIIDVIIRDVVLNKGFIKESHMGDSMANLIDKAWKRIQQG
tara:strand:+ start:324 stop:515 length:192 start_codon:yes stop_codon:yes gene_type:complete